MKTLTAALLATAFIASPALACSYGKTAKAEDKMTTAEAKIETQDAISTFDPATKPVFETHAVDDEPVITKDATDAE